MTILQEDQLFLELARYHVRNFFGLRPKAAVEGAENKASKGLFLVTDGPHLDELVEAHVKQDAVDFDPVNLDGICDLIESDSAEGFEDGAYLLRNDGGYELSTPVKLYGVVEALPGQIDTVLEPLLPEDFVSASPTKLRNRKMPVVANVGTKTTLAVALPQLYGDVRTYAIKSSMYDNMYTGKLVCFTGDGLIAELFLRKVDGLDNEFYLQDKVAVVLRQHEFNRDKGRVEMINEQYVPVSEVLPQQALADTA